MLDDDLPAVETAALRQRLAGDPLLAEALAELKAGRALRVGAFQTMEPTQAEADRLTWAVRGAILQDQKLANLAPRRARGGLDWGLLGRVAAVMVLGFFAGYIYRGGPAGTALDATVPVAAVQPAVPTGQQVANSDGSQMLTPVGVIHKEIAPQGAPVQGGGGVINVAAQTQTPPRGAGMFVVTIRDEAGNIIGMPRFDSMEKAQAFINELNAVQQRQRQMQSDGVKLTAD
jgi:hypothetical protein